MKVNMSAIHYKSIWCLFQIKKQKGIHSSYFLIAIPGQQIVEISVTDHEHFCHFIFTLQIIILWQRLLKILADKFLNLVKNPWNSLEHFCLTLTHDLQYMFTVNSLLLYGKLRFTKLSSALKNALKSANFNKNCP